LVQLLHFACERVNDIPESADRDDFPKLDIEPEVEALLERVEIVSVGDRVLKQLHLRARERHGVKFS
jgi:hypothetical protein